MGEPAAAQGMVDAQPLSAIHEMAETIERRFDAHLINKIANIPDVQRWVRGYAQVPLDLSNVAADDANVLLTGQHGCMMFMPKLPNIFECHTLIAPAGRGEWGKTFVQACFHQIFTLTDCLEVVTKIPKGNLGARVMAKLCHFTPEFVQKAGWVLDLDPIPAEWFSLHVQTWMRTAPGLRERGVWFHDRLEAAFKRLGREEENHPDDEVHDRHVGAAVELLLGGQVDKAVVFYNRWAAMAGYAPIEIACPNPLLVDIGSAVLRFTDDGFDVLKLK
jgi:hypothetical protein